MALFGLLPQGLSNPMLPAQPSARDENLASPMPPMPTEQPIGLLGTLGVKGGFRDILGQLGDALLIANDVNPMYAPAKKQNALNSAMQGYDSDPMSAIRRVAQIDPAKAQEMLAAYEEAQIEKREADRDDAKFDIDKREKDWKYRDDVLQSVGSWMGAATPENWAMLRPRLQETLDRTGIDAPFDLPETFDSNLVNNWINSAIDAEAQRRMEFEAGRLDQGQQRIEETRRSNRVKEGQSAEKIGVSKGNAQERRRSNKVREKQGQQRLEIYKTKGTTKASPTRKVFRNGKIVEI